jgi:hypothetical protein
MSRLLLLLAVAFAVVRAQDPAPGWTAYATATCPPNSRLTKMQAKWTVLGNANPSQAFYSPWFGSDTSDNLNLLQPVNPWFGSSWNFYTEYYQWSPTNNQDSTSYGTQTGHVLQGEIVFNGADKQSYDVIQTDTTSGQTSKMTIPVQKHWSGDYKNYSVLYDYPPDEKVTFEDVLVQCDGQTITPQWKTAAVDEVCDFAAHVDSPTQISITWNTKSDKLPAKQWIEASQRDKTFGRYRPHQLL